MQDPIVEEIREIRKEIEDEYGNDVKKHLEHIYETQKRHSGRLVSRKPRRIQKRKVA